MFRTMFRAALCGVAMLSATGVSEGSAVEFGSQAAGPVTPADAAGFVGDWSLALQGQNGPANFSLTVKVDKEKVVADLSSEMQPNQTITDISKSDKSLVLNYSFDYQGTPVPVTVTLTPEAEKITAVFDFAGGAYVMNGTGTKKDKSKEVSNRVGHAAEWRDIRRAPARSVLIAPEPAP
jgi:hypothetical protein